MNYFPLVEVADIVMGQSPPSSAYNSNGEGLPFFQGKTEFGDLYPTARFFCTEPKKFAEPNDILISVRAPVGPTNINSAKSCIGRGLAAIRCSEKIDLYYLLYFLRFNEPKLAQLGQGSTFEAINRDDLEGIQVPLPPIAEQKRIASIAQKCDRLRRTRRYTQQLSDGYLQSVFLQMFGGEESEKWEFVKVEDVAKSGKNTIRTGPFGSQLLHEEFQPEGDIAVLGIDNVVQNFFTWGKKRFITEQKYQELKRYRVFPGDVLITIMGTCGRCVVVPKNISLAINTKHLCCVTLDQKHCLPTYLQHFFLRHPSALRQLGVSERGAVMPGLNMGLIKDLVMPLPPLPLQEKFAQIVQRFERLRVQQREGDRQAEHLFQTVLHRAFRGEL